MEKISNEEQHCRLLEIAKVFDLICRSNDIPYYMLGGTMLGAIRHKGFIPWDDDMDFGVPRKCYSKLIDILNTELPKQYRCCSYRTDPDVFSPFFKIEDLTTVIVDPRIPLPVEKQMGINIDVFPLDYCNIDTPIANKVSKLTDIYSLIYVDSDNESKVKNTIKQVLRYIIPYTKVEFLDKLNALLESMDDDGGSLLANIFGRWRKKEWIPKEWYGMKTMYPFENITLCGLKEYDKYLRQMYGDYMQLPPKDKQKPHALDIYKR